MTHSYFAVLSFPTFVVQLCSQIKFFYTGGGKKGKTLDFPLDHHHTSSRMSFAHLEAYFDADFHVDATSAPTVRRSGSPVWPAMVDDVSPDPTSQKNSAPSQSREVVRSISVTSNNCKMRRISAKWINMTLISGTWVVQVSFHSFLGLFFVTIILLLLLICNPKRFPDSLLKHLITEMAQECLCNRCDSVISHRALFLFHTYRFVELGVFVHVHVHSRYVCK